jgi:hypothetical protein
VDVQPKEEIIYAGPRRRSTSRVRSDSRRRSGHHGFEGTVQPYYRESGWRGGDTGYYPPPPVEGGWARRYCGRVMEIPEGMTW